MCCSRDSWVYLHEVLGIVEPYKVYLEKFDLKTEVSCILYGR